jgi:photosystem II stability/assembly factor-like uncharacterized protein
MTPQLSLKTTTDGGTTWRSIPVPALTAAPGGSEGGAIYLHFINPQIGWAVIQVPSSSNFKLGNLFQTTDGGNSWTKLTIPIGEPVRFLTPELGWTAGGADGNELYITRDGGRTWDAQVVVPADARGNGQVLYDLPSFDQASPQEGVLPVTFTDPAHQRVVFYYTHKGSPC